MAFDQEAPLWRVELTRADGTTRTYVLRAADMYTALRAAGRGPDFGSPDDPDRVVRMVVSEAAFFDAARRG